MYYQGELLSEITKKQGERKGNRLILGYGVVASEELGLQNHRQELFQEAPHKRKSFGFYHLDEQNSTAFITGKNQEIQNSYTYDAFGNVRNQKETLHNRILYTGQQYDRESNQYYLRARYYNPTLGRFAQEDVYRGDGLNLYDYCKENPVIWYDPSGYKGNTLNYPPRTDEAYDECVRVCNEIDNLKKSGAYGKFDDNPAVSIFIHEDGSVSVGMSGSLQNEQKREIFERLSTKLEDNLNDNKEAKEFYDRNNGKKKYAVARGIDPELKQKLESKKEKLEYIEENKGNPIGQCAEPKASSIASKNNSPIVGMDTRWRAKKKKNNHIYDGKDRKDDNQMKPCITCGIYEEEYMGFATRGSRKSQDIDENKSGKCSNSK